MKTTLPILLALLCGIGGAYAQTLSFYELSASADPDPDSIPQNVLADPLNQGAGISAFDFSGTDAAAMAWPTVNTPSSEDYAEICLSAAPGYQLMADSLFFDERRTAEGPRAFELRYSTDGFASSTQLSVEALPDDTQSRSYTYSKLALSACDSRPVCFRWYAYQSESYNGDWALSNVRIAGVVEEDCAEPTAPPFSFGTINAGVETAEINLILNPNFDINVLVIARELGTEEWLPCSGEELNANHVFGLGDMTGPGNFAVSDEGSTFTLTGLQSGTSYQLTALQYSDNTFCYGKSGAIRTTFSTECGLPTASELLQVHPEDGGAILSWELPACYEELMLLASESPVLAAPASPDGSSYVPDTVYAQASGTGDLPAGVFPVFKGSGSSVTLTQMTNGSTYYCRLYTRLGTEWLAGPEVSVAPAAPCPVNGDALFISELHYRSTDPIVDKGVELTGRAGTDLGNYQLALYSGFSFMDEVGDNGVFQLEGLMGDDLNGVGSVWVPLPDLVEGAGGVALFNTVRDTVVEVFSYRIGGSAIFDGGPADGISPPTTGITQNTGTPLNQSLQRTNDGFCPDDEVWYGPLLASRGLINDVQGAPLPISLLFFEAERSGQQSRLRWRTATELNNDYMAVEHSTDGRRYEEIGRVAGAGTTQQAQDYQFTHHDPGPGLNYYRLRQVDYDGQYEYHGPVSLRFGEADTELEVFPTVVSEALGLRYNGQLRPGAALHLHAADGQLLRRVPMPAGSAASLQLSVADLPAGLYLLRLQNGRELVNARFIKP